MERFQDKIHISQYYALDRLSTKNTHVAHFDRGRSCKVYLCQCCREIRISKTEVLVSWAKRRKQTNFQRRSAKYSKRLT